MSETKRVPLFGMLVCQRTSTAYREDDRPCGEAELVQYLRVDRRCTDDPLKNKYIGASWYTEGKNHRIESGMITRDFDDQRWMVSIPDGASLLVFIEKYGDVIISLNTDGTVPCYGIEIYDGYRG